MAFALESTSEVVDVVLDAGLACLLRCLILSLEPKRYGVFWC